MRICAYSSLIFACNTTVLLIVSLSTDYWEYRTFDRAKLLAIFQQTNTTRLVIPYDTSSYFQIVHRSVISKASGLVKPTKDEEALYHAPLFVRKLVAKSIIEGYDVNKNQATINKDKSKKVGHVSNKGKDIAKTGTNTVKNSKPVKYTEKAKLSDAAKQSKSLAKKQGLTHGNQVVAQNGDVNSAGDLLRMSTGNAKFDAAENAWKMKQDVGVDVITVLDCEINLFEQYGNLFRDCDNLEVVVRSRLGLKLRRPSKCVYFHAAWATSGVYNHAQALAHIESWAAVAALLCMLTICAGSTCGARALFSRYQRLTSYSIASTLSLAAGFFLTLGIALFHAKCQLLRKMELLPGHELPFRELLDSSRVYSYGWSFILAWVCVLFCYAASYVWLTKAQGPKSFVMLWYPRETHIQQKRHPHRYCQGLATV